MYGVTAFNFLIFGLILGMALGRYQARLQNEFAQLTAEQRSRIQNNLVMKAPLWAILVAVALLSAAPAVVLIPFFFTTSTADAVAFMWIPLVIWTAAMAAMGALSMRRWRRLMREEQDRVNHPAP